MEQKGDGAIDDSSIISTAMALLLFGGTIIFPSGGTYLINTNITIPSNITLKVDNGAIIKVGTGITFTINGNLDVGLYTIFTGDGLIRGNMLNSDIYPHWWGAKGDNETDCAPAIIKAIDYLHSIKGGTLSFGNGQFLYTSPLNIDVASITLKGNGAGATVLIGNSATGNLINIGTGETLLNV